MSQPDDRTWCKEQLMVCGVSLTCGLLGFILRSILKWLKFPEFPEFAVIAWEQNPWHVAPIEASILDWSWIYKSVCVPISFFWVWRQSMLQLKSLSNHESSFSVGVGQEFEPWTSEIQHWLLFPLIRLVSVINTLLRHLSHSLQNRPFVQDL